MTEQASLPGLQPFNALQAEHFSGALTGRQALAQDLYSTWRHQGQHGRTFLALLGAPNSGKSSLLRAGVLPLLKHDKDLNAAHWRQVVWYPSDDLSDPLRGLANALLKALPELEQQQHMHTEQLTKLLQEHGKAVELLLKTTLDLLSNTPTQPNEDTPLTRLVLLIENLEHLLLPSFSEAQRELICARLAGLASSGRCWILASLDDNAAESISHYPPFAKLLAGTGQYRLQAPQAEQWQNILHASLSEKAVDSGLYTQVFHAVQQQPYPLSHVQAVFKLAQKGKDWAAMGGLSGALEQLLRLELADFPAEELQALPAILAHFALTSEETKFYTCRQPLTRLGQSEAQREALQRLLDKQCLWQEKQGEVTWIGGNAVVLQSLHKICENAPLAAPVTPPAAPQNTADNAKPQRFFPWRPALIMVLIGLLLGLAVGFFPQYKDWASEQMAALQTKGQDAPAAAAAPPTDSSDSSATADNSALPNLPDTPPLPAEPPTLVLEPEPRTSTTQTQDTKPEVRPHTATTPAHLDQLAAQQEQQKQWAKALALYEQALAIRLDLRADDTSDLDLLSALSRNYDQIGNVQKRLAQPKAALLSYHEALSVSHRLNQLDPASADNQRDLAISYQRIGDLQQTEKDYAQAQEHYLEALNYFKQAAETEKTRRNQRALANAYDKLGDLQVLQNDNKAALSSYQSALSVRQILLQKYRDQRSQQDVMYSHSKINSLWQTTR